MMPTGCIGGAELGTAIADHFMTNAKKYGVVYIIWQQRIWNGRTDDPKPPSQWRSMGNRGSCTANHMDHVHVSVTGPTTVG